MDWRMSCVNYTIFCYSAAHGKHLRHPAWFHGAVQAAQPETIRKYCHANQATAQSFSMRQRT